MNPLLQANASRSKMNKSFVESHRGLLYVRYCMYEALVVATVTALVCKGYHHRSPFDDVVGWTFWFAFVGLLAVSLILRREARRLAVLGYISLFLGFWSSALFPAL